MKGLVINTDNLMRIEEYAAPIHKSIGKTVGGWIEAVHPKLLPAPYCMIVNEEGLLLNLPINLMGSTLYETKKHGNPIVGNIVLVKEGIVEGERDFIGLDDDDISMLGAMITAMSDGAVKWESTGVTMARFYFTYGTDSQPFFGGWTEVEAPNGHAACAAFRAFHPDRTEGIINCASIYDEEHFKQTEMCRVGNFGYRCHEVITLRREAATN